MSDNAMMRGMSTAVARYGEVERFDEKASLKLMRQYSRSFDAGFFQYSREADKLMHPTLMGKVGTAMRELVARQVGVEVPSLSESYGQMMSSLGGMNTELGKLYNVHFHAGQALRNLVESRSKRSIEVAQSYDKMEELLQRDDGFRRLLQSELSDANLPLMDRVQKKLGVTLLNMKLYGEMRMQRGFEEQALELEGSVERLTSAHNGQVDVFMMYGKACDAGNIMLEELEALGPSHIASVYLESGTAMVHDRLRRVSAYNQTIKNCIDKRASTGNKVRSQQSAPYTMRTNLTDFVSAFE